MFAQTAHSCFVFFNREMRVKSIAPMNLTLMSLVKNTKQACPLDTNIDAGGVALVACIHAWTNSQLEDDQHARVQHLLSHILVQKKLKSSKSGNTNTL